MYLSHHVKLLGLVGMYGVFKGECFVHNNTETVVAVATKLSPVNDNSNTFERVCVSLGCVHRKQV